MNKLPYKLMAFDASRQAYLPIITEAADIAGWTILSYDDESYAMEDLVVNPFSALVAVLHDSSFAYADFAGKELIASASSIDVPISVIAQDNIALQLQAETPDLFIPKKPGQIVKKLSSWLINIRNKH